MSQKNVMQEKCHARKMSCKMSCKNVMQKCHAKCHAKKNVMQNVMHDFQKCHAKFRFARCINDTDGWDKGLGPRGAGTYAWFEL